MSEPVIEGLIPGAGIEGGEVMIRCSGFDFARYDQARAMFGGVETRLVSASSQLVVAPVRTDTLLYGKIAVTLLNANSISDGKEFVIGQKIAENLHPVSNPAVDRDTGAVYTTLSGSRGQKVPVSVYKISDGESEPFLSDLVNPTAIAFNPDGEMFITGRYEGSVYRVTPFKEAEVFAQNLGIATGIAFDHDGRMFVGDRNGTIYLVGENGESTAFAAMEASVAAFHLAFGPDGNLYAAGPTMSSFDSIVKIDKNGDTSLFYTGLGRPQGLAFDRDGNLYVAASLSGHRGIVRVTPKGEAGMFLAGNSIVGLCFDEQGSIVVATNRELYRVPVGVEGYWPF